MLCLTISDIAIITVNNVDYRGIMYNSKSKAIHSLEISVLEDSGYVQKSIALILSQFFFLLFLFSIYKMVDGMDTYKTLNINIGTVMKISEMLKLIPDHLETKQMYNYAVKKLPYQISSVRDR